MDIGVGIFPTNDTIRLDRLAVAAEERGFSSLWIAEHTHIPVDHAPYPGGAELPAYYRHTWDPFISLTLAATATSRLVVATGICLLAQHDPIITAKAVATLDQVSGGRFRFGVGYGWNRPETESHGVPFERRRDVVHERLSAMKALWTEDVAAFEGEFVHLPPSSAWPKPVQRPHPPVVLGAAAGPRTFERLVRDFDGWMPIPGRGGSLLELVPALGRACEDAGRDPSSMSVWVTNAKADRETLDRYDGLGVTGLFYWLPQGPPEEVLSRLDELTDLTEGYRGWSPNG